MNSLILFLYYLHIEKYKKSIYKKYRKRRKLFTLFTHIF
nr:MAG TPA: hypothetical protein [Caudoviricetes sp.]